MELNFLTDNAIIYVLIAWVAIFAVAKGLRLEKYGFSIKPYSLTYKNYKVQDLKSNTGSHWGWLYAYVSRFPDHENIQRLKRWSKNKSELNSYQSNIVNQYLNIGKKGFGSASWTVVEPNCHFTK